jgi:hypothetical protein
MARVLIIGAGGVGGVVTHKCAQVPEVFSEIVLASRTVSKCDAIAAQIDADIETAAVDADNVPELVALIRRVQPDPDFPDLFFLLAMGLSVKGAADVEPEVSLRHAFVGAAHASLFDDTFVGALQSRVVSLPEPL